MIDRFYVSCCETISKNWTPTAIDCYKLGCNCSKCNIYKIYFSDSLYKCQMRNVVLKLVRTLGRPEQNSEDEQNEQG